MNVVRLSRRYVPNVNLNVRDDRIRNFALSSVGGYAIGTLIVNKQHEMAALALALLGILVKPDLTHLQMDWSAIQNYGILSADYSNDTALIVGAICGLYASSLDYSSAIGLALATTAFFTTSYMH